MPCTGSSPRQAARAAFMGHLFGESANGVCAAVPYAPGVRAAYQLVGSLQRGEWPVKGVSRPHVCGVSHNTWVACDIAYGTMPRRPLTEGPRRSLPSAPWI